MAVFYPLQRSIAPRRRNHRWVGKPRIKLAEQLDQKLTAMGYQCEIEAEKIRPAQGSWRTDIRLDVLRVEGALKISGPATNGLMMGRNLESWSTITDMLRYGFSVEIGPLSVSIESLKGSPEAKKPRRRKRTPEAENAALLKDANSYYSAGQLEEIAWNASQLGGEDA